MRPLNSLFIIFGLVLLGVGTAGRVEAQGIVKDIKGLQASIDELQTQVEDIQFELERLLPAWDRIIPAGERFAPALDGAAVLDRETGLVWEQSPASVRRDWDDAMFLCNARRVADRSGWRLPTYQELASLEDSTQLDPALPDGHPFDNVEFGEGDRYWSASSSAVVADRAWFVTFNGAGNLDTQAKVVTNFVWCVRGGHGGPDAQ